MNHAAEQRLFTDGDRQIKAGVVGLAERDAPGRAVVVAEEVDAFAVGERARPRAEDRRRHQPREQNAGAEQRRHAGPDPRALEHARVEGGRQQIGHLLLGDRIPVAKVGARDARIAIGRENSVEPEILHGGHRELVERIVVVLQAQPVGRGRVVFLDVQREQHHRARAAEVGRRADLPMKIEVAAAGTERGVRRRPLRTDGEGRESVRSAGRGLAHAGTLIGIGGPAQRLDVLRVVRGPERARRRRAHARVVVALEHHHQQILGAHRAQLGQLRCGGHALGGLHRSRAREQRGRQPRIVGDRHRATRDRGETGEHGEHRQPARW